MQDLITGLDGVMFNDLMENIEWFFNMHDKNKDGFLTKDEVLTLSESFLFIFRYEVGDAYLGAVSRFMTNAFEYGDALLPPHPDEIQSGDAKQEDEPKSPRVIESNQPYLNLATFRMVVLADEILESFFEADLSNSFKLETIPDAEVPTTPSGLLGDLWSTIATDTNKKIFNMFTDEIGKTIGKHQIINRPSIGRYTKLEEPKARESLLTPSMKKSPSKSSLIGTVTPTTSITTPPTSSLTVDVKAQPLNVSQIPATAGLTPMVQAVNARLMERTPFAIDDAKDDDSESDDEKDNDDQVMDEVDAFLEAHDSGLTDADKEVANDLLHAEPMK